MDMSQQGLNAGLDTRASNGLAAPPVRASRTARRRAGDDRPAPGGIAEAVERVTGFVRRHRLLPALLAAGVLAVLWASLLTYLPVAP